MRAFLIVVCGLGIGVLLLALLVASFERAGDATRPVASAEPAASAQLPANVFSQKFLSFTEVQRNAASAKWTNGVLAAATAMSTPSVSMVLPRAKPKSPGAGRVSFLAEGGFEAVHWSDIGSGSAPDSELMQWALPRAATLF
jgi:hypothetical protein